MKLNMEEKNEIVMKLLHYFITKKNYKPIIMSGLKNEIWLENFKNKHKIVRIVSREILNDNQLNNDIFVAKKIVNRIRLKTYSLFMSTVNIYVNSSENIEDIIEKNHKYLNIYDEKELSKLNEYFPDAEKELEFTQEGIELFMKITSDINKKNLEESYRVQKIFKERKPYATTLFLLINLLYFLWLEFFGFGSNNIISLIEAGALYTPLVRAGEYYRILTSVFIHIGLIHFAFNNYALYIIGSQLEMFYGSIRFFLIYIFSGIMGSLFSIIFVNEISAGASGALFGLLGALIYFGYNNRAVLGSSFFNNAVTILVLNLLLGFIIPGINVAAHIGGFIGGLLMAITVGYEQKSDIFNIINGFIAMLVLTIGIVYLGFFEKGVYRNEELDNIVYNYYMSVGETDKAKEYMDKVTMFESK